MKKLIAVILGHLAFFICAVAILFVFGSAKLVTYQPYVIYQIAACMTAAALIMTILCAVFGRSKKKTAGLTHENNTVPQEPAAAASDAGQL